MASNDPVFPVELVDGILSHLEKDDLLNCRFVSKSWNKLCLNHLNKSGFTIHLESNQINKYVDLIKSTESAQNLRIKVSQGSNTSLTDFAKFLDSLINCTRSECIVALRLHHFYSPEYAQFLPTLEKLSPGLLSLHIDAEYRGPNFQYERPLEIADFVIKLQAMQFPKLKHLTCRIWPFHPLPEPDPLSSTLIGRCPSLQNLELIQAKPTKVNIPFGSGLKSLALPIARIDPSPVVQQIKACQNKLTLNAFTLDSISLADDIEFQTAKCILQELSPYLKALALTVPYDNSEPIPCPMQVLRVLDIRKLYFWGIRDRDSRLLHNLRPALLPSLTDISFPIGLYFKNDLELPLDNSEVFYTVRKITTRFRQWNKPISGFSLTPMSPVQIQKCWTHIFSVFPNANNVTVQESENWHELDLGDVIHCLVQCPQAVGVQELTVINYETDYIGKFLHVLDNPPRISITLDNCTTPGKETGGFYANTFVADLFAKLGVESNKLEMASDVHSPYKQTLTAAVNKNASGKCYLKNISKLRLLRGPKANESDSSEFALDFDADLGCFPDVQKILHVDLFAKHFPNLRSLELSSKILSSNYFTVWKKIRQIESRYPTWTVNATCRDFKWTPVPSIH